MTDRNWQDSGDLREPIAALIRNDFEDEIKDAIESKKCLAQSTNWLDYISQIVNVFAILVTFASGFYKVETLAFIGGSLGVLCTALSKLSKYTDAERKERQDTITQSTKTIHLENQPEIIITNT
jgi:hypothetical protein